MARSAAPDPAAAKGVWRAWARNVRASQPVGTLSHAVCDAIGAWEPYREATTVLAYLAFGSEVDLTPLLRDPAKRVVVPRAGRPVDGDEGPGALTLHPLRDAVLERSALGMLEPAAGSPEVDPAEVDLALLPGLCFDVHGTRLGHGRGYFDAFLGRLSPAAPRVGVTLEALIVPRLPRQPHDVPVTHLVTEAGVRPTGFAESSDDGSDRSAPGAAG